MSFAEHGQAPPNDASHAGGVDRNGDEDDDVEEQDKQQRDEGQQDKRHENHDHDQQPRGVGMLGRIAGLDGDTLLLRWRGRAHPSRVVGAPSGTTRMKGPAEAR